MREKRQDLTSAALGLAVLAALGRPAAAEELSPLPLASGAGVVDINEKRCDASAPNSATMTKVRLVVRDTLRPIGPYLVSLPAYSSPKEPGPPPAVEPWGPYQVNIKPGQTLRIDLVDDLKDKETIPEAGFADQKEKNANDKAVNLHTHGLIVEPRPFSPCGTLGDYIFSAVDSKAVASYRITIPERVAGAYLHLPKGDYAWDGKGPFPVGPYWIHSHFHGLAKDAVLAGQSAFLSVDCPHPERKAECPNGAAAQNVQPDDVKVLALRDVQIVTDADHAPDKIGRPDPGATTANGYFAKGAYNPKLCYDGAPKLGLGYCFEPLIKRDDSGDPIKDANNAEQPIPLGDYGVVDKDNNPSAVQAHGVWLFTVNGQLYPTITIKPDRKQIWRVANMSGVMTYRLNIAKTNGQAVDKVEFEIVSVDGVIAGTPSVGGFTPNRNATELLLMPGARAEILVPWKQAGAGDKYTLENEAFCTGVADDPSKPRCTADPWPAAHLAEIVMQPAPPKPAAQMLSGAAPLAGVAASAPALAPFTRRPIVPDADDSVSAGAKTGPSPVNCIGLPKAGYRTIRFEQDGANFFIGPLDTDAADDTKRLAEVRSFRHDSPPAIRKHICVAGGPVPRSSNPRKPQPKEHAELWLLQNNTAELHNFHIHQSKFRLATPQEAKAKNLGDVFYDPAEMLQKQAASLVKALRKESEEEGAVWHDSIPVPPRKLKADGSSDPGHVAIVIPFSDENQLGTFVYHCHILEHEDGGMMGVVEVYNAARPRYAAADSPVRSAGFCGQVPADYTPIPVRDPGWRARLADLIGL